MEGSTRVLASLTPHLCGPLPTIGLVVCLPSRCQASGSLPSPLLVALLRGNAGLGPLDNCIGDSSPTSRRDGAGGHGAVLPTAASFVGGAVCGGPYVCWYGASADSTAATCLLLVACSLLERGGPFMPLPVWVCAWLVCVLGQREGGKGGRGWRKGTEGERLSIRPYSLGGLVSLAPTIPPLPPTLGSRKAPTETPNDAGFLDNSCDLFRRGVHV